MLLASACAKGVKEEEVAPFLVDKKQVKQDVDVIAVAPVAIPDGLPDAESIEAWFNGELEAKLHEGRFSLLFPAEYVKYWDEAVEAVGGITDPDTGERDHAMVAAAMKNVLDRLEFTPHVDGLFVGTVKVVEAPFAGGSAYWDGTKQSIKTGNPMKEFMAGSPDGKVGALSLKVTLFDIDNNVLYERGGGIEVLSKMSGREFQLVPRNELLKDQKRMQKAVERALDPLID